MSSPKKKPNSRNYLTAFEPSYVEFNEKAAQLTKTFGIFFNSPDSEVLKTQIETIKEEISYNELSFIPESLYTRFATIQELNDKKKDIPELCPGCGEEIKKVVQCQFCAEIYCKHCCWRKRALPNLPEEPFRIGCQICHSKFVRLFANQKFYLESQTLFGTINFLKSKFEKHLEKKAHKQALLNQYKQLERDNKIKLSALEKNILDEEKKKTKVEQELQLIVQERAKQMELKKQEEEARKKRLEEEMLKIQREREEENSIAESKRKQSLDREKEEQQKLQKQLDEERLRQQAIKMLEERQQEEKRQQERKKRQLQAEIEASKRRQEDERVQKEILEEERYRKAQEEKIVNRPRQSRGDYEEEALKLSLLISSMDNGEESDQSQKNERTKSSTAKKSAGREEEFKDQKPPTKSSVNGKAPQKPSEEKKGKLNISEMSVNDLLSMKAPDLPPKRVSQKPISEPREAQEPKVKRKESKAEEEDRSQLSDEPITKDPFKDEILRNSTLLSSKKDEREESVQPSKCSCSIM